MVWKEIFRKKEATVDAPKRVAVNAEEHKTLAGLLAEPRWGKRGDLEVNVGVHSNYHFRVVYYYLNISLF